MVDCQSVVLVGAASEVGLLLLVILKESDWITVE